MTEHLSTRSLEQYRLRTLPPAELLRADEHIAACDSCRRRAGEDVRAERVLRAMDASLRSAAADAAREHLSFEQLADFVDGRLDAAEREVIGSHLELCRLCEEEAADLRSYRNTLAAEPGRPGRGAASGRHGLAALLAGFRNLFATATPLRVAAALLVIVSASLLCVIVWRQSRPAAEVADGTTRQAAEDVSIPAAVSPPQTPPIPGADNSAVTPTPAVSDPETPQVAVALDDAGGRVTLNAGGEIEGLPPLSPAARQAVRNALAEGRVRPAPVPTGLRGKPETLMGGPEGTQPFSLVGPVGRIVRDARPRLSWRPLAGASGYTVTVLDADLKPVAASPPLSGTSWVVPRRLERGRVYTWQVTALKDGEEVIAPAAPAPPARFKVLEAALDDELSRLERAGARSHLALGVLYARAGLLEQAERELRALARANPQSVEARRLLNSMRAARSGRR